MSIPPLVCSTPPPPDQCEDDKDPEDFDLHYNLSQEDDYDYGSFSTYNHFQTAISVNKPLSDPAVENVETNHVMPTDSTITEKKIPELSLETKLSNEQKQEIEIKVNNDSSTDTEYKVNTMKQPHHEEKDKENLHVDKKVNEEDLNIEDLNLTIEEDSINTMVKNEFYDNPDSDKSDSSDSKEKSAHIPDSTSSIIASDPNETIHLDEITPPSIDDINDRQHSIEDLKMDDDHSTDYNDIKNEADAEPEPEPNFEIPTEIQDSQTFKEAPNEVNNETDDEFGDFNDFHSTLTSDNKAATVIDAGDNPWETNQADSDFGAFEAHFDDAGNSETTLFQDFTTKVEESDPINQLGQVKSPEDYDDDDDFGDFDDFKSSAQEATDKEEIKDPMSQVPVLDFQTSESESQILENINKILNSVFEEDIPEPESVFDGKLEALLCETWGHLLETDVRQPYIVNWNSSIGQKTLLKALCIDSRNILFGPKWSYNMPKYAANLSAAPLQPQKQTAPSGPIQSDASEKHVPKHSGTWSDPFTSDGQESCNKESSATAQKRPTDLNVFDTALSTKADKIFSTTLDVQPIRQISLPDTHIFTPTDSETPRSKTIHYNGPAVFMSQSSIESDIKPTDIKTSETTTDAAVLDDADYSDFQDFKGSFKTDTPEVKPVPSLSTDVAEPLRDVSQLPSTSAATSVGILQPIKIEPLMPTLNWPSPGEVKETFDDFSEFASSTTWSNDIQETQTPTISDKTHQIDNIDIINDKSIKHNEATPSKINDSFDDDFDTFQSALPTDQPAEAASSISNFNDFVSGDFSQNKLPQGTSNREQDLDFVFPKVDTKSDPISLTKSNDILNVSDPFMQQNNETTSVLTAKEPIAKIPAMPTPGPLSTVLQPTVSSSQTHQNSAQILQPLSLESFSQINWPNPGINLQDLSRFNPVETLNSLKSDLSVSGSSKNSPAHTQKNSVQNPPEDDIWGDFVSSKPKPQQTLPKKATTFVDDDEWTDFVSSPAVKPQNGLNTISFNVHTNLSVQKSSKQPKQNNQALEIPITHYITPKSGSHSSYNDRHFQNL